MTTSPAVELQLDGADATTDLGRRIGAAARKTGGVVALSGHLGAGKTTFVKGLAEGLGVAAARDVVSPTFLRAVRFDGPVALVHVDAYRMKGAADMVELGLDEDMAGGACVAVEWPEMVEGALPSDRLVVRLDHVSDARRDAHVSATGPESARWLARAGLVRRPRGNRK
jgi:tRNA threonylcarbamoyl adenosine modification protein YjeE